jgi:hypothetical protein
MIDRDKLKDLTRSEGLAISLYAPMHRVGKDTRENPIRFKNLLQSAREQLERQGFKKDDLDDLFGEAAAKVDDYDFWQNQSSGLATFITPGRTEMFQVPLGLPEFVTVGKHFYLRPLIPVVFDDKHFFVLAVTLKKVRLFEATRDTFEELDLESLERVPTSLEEATRFDVHQEQMAPRDVSAGAAGSEAVFHGQADEDTKKEDIRFFFEHLENGVTKLLASEQAPLVFVGVEYLFPIYREANHYRALHDEAVTGSPDEWPDREIHRRAWELLAPRFEARKEAALERFGSARSSDKGSAQLSEILPAAQDGRVETLLIREGARRWGVYHEEERRISLQDSDNVDNDDLYDLATLYTLQGGGTVMMVDALPGDDNVAAIYRY